MKKIALVVLCSLLFVAGISHASDTISKRVYSYGITNRTGDMQVTVAPTTTIRPFVDKVIGYTVQPLSSGASECYIGLFDGTDNSLSGEVLAENEALQGESKSELWAFGKYISEGVVISQGAMTQVQIYFVKE